VTHGLDTGFLVAAELVEHADQFWARQKLVGVLGSGDRLAIAPQVIAEFIHVVTDSRRFAQPLNFKTACDLAEQWWTAADVDRVFPNENAVRQFLKWIQQHQLGRKRLLDTLLAATYKEVGVQSLLTTNPGDFVVFGVFSVISP
jgi:predicted nucleic acid-binding protein